MGRVTIYGASDDLIEVEGDVPGCDEYNVGHAEFTLVGEGGQLYMAVTYGVGGVWSVMVAPVDEDIPMLPVSVTGEGYTARADVEGVTNVILRAAA